MYQALYRKYRPMVFTDVVGQTAVTDTLRAQVSGGRLSHAYLFTGTRGTGKTTCAKILARAANCLSPAGGNPCNKCAPCLGALDGSLLDVMEIDAASNSGVDNIRALRDEAAYTPVSAAKRVYIIDEVHMLSAGAFNALLKTLEEPPEYVLFILATTETHKVPATILSRCQRFAFRRLTEKDISERLMYVAKMESLKLTVQASELLARLADGALRDGLSLLDQVAASFEGELDIAQVYQALGMAGENDILRLAEAMSAGDSSTAISIFTEQVELGRDISSLLGELSQVLRGEMLNRLNGTAPSAELAVKSLSAPRLLDMLSTVQEALSRMTRSPQPRIEAELCVLKLCRLNGSTELEIIAPIVTAVKPVLKPAPKPEPQPEAVKVEAVPEPEPEPQVKPEQEVSVETEKAPEKLKDREDTAKEFKRKAASEMPMSKAGFLDSDDVVVEIEEGLWKLTVQDELTLSRLSDKKVVAIMESTASGLAGHPVSVRVQVKDEPAKPRNERLQALLDNFK